MNISSQVGKHGTDDQVSVEICSDVDVSSCCKYDACTDTVSDIRATMMFMSMSTQV